MTEPTDDELDAVIAEYRTRIYPQDMHPRFERAIMRAAIAKWGTPPAVVERLEVTEAECEAAVLELEIEDLRTTQQPTQTQAGAVPLTDEQIEALPLWKRFVGLWPETRREIVRTIERHHGIKGDTP